MKKAVIFLVLIFSSLFILFIFFYLPKLWLKTTQINQARPEFENIKLINLGLESESKQAISEEKAYLVNSKAEKITHKGFSELPKNSPMYDDSVEFKYIEGKDYPKSIIFKQGLKINALKDISVLASPADPKEQALEFIDDYKPILGIEKKDLKEENAMNIEKMDMVLFHQEYKNIPVYLARVVVAKSSENLVFFGSSYYNGIDINTNPKISVQDAIKKAKDYLNTEKGPIKNPVLYIYPSSDNGTTSYLLIFKIDFPAMESNQYFINETIYVPSVFVDAHTGSIIKISNNLREEQITGRIYGEIIPDYYGQKTEEKNFAHEYVNSGDYIAQTDIDGNYNFEIGSNNQVETSLQGPYVKVIDAISELTQNKIFDIPPYQNDINWNLHDNSYKKEASNVFYHVNRIHDYFTKGPAPFTVNSLDFQMPVVIQIQDTCNAYADGNSINFYTAGGGCEALSLYSDVIYHEYTHNVAFRLAPRLSEVYWGETGNMNEGYADYFACSLNNNSCLSEDAFYLRDCLRNCENDKKFPDNYGEEPHYAAEIISGSIWDIRKSAGIETADILALSALSYDPQTFGELLDYFVIVDEAIYGDGNIDNGIYHGDEICDSFGKHGIYSLLCLNYFPTGSLKVNTNVPGAVVYIKLGDNDAFKFAKTPMASAKALQMGNYKVIINKTGYFSETRSIEIKVRETAELNVDLQIIPVLLFEAFTLRNEGKTLPINGTAAGFNFKNFTLKWGKSKNPSEWSTSGIELIDNGAREIIKGMIASWDTNSLEDGAYTLLLTLNYDDGSSYNASNIIYFDSRIKEGWPFSISWKAEESFKPTYGNVIAADINTDNQKELIFFTGGSLTSPTLGQLTLYVVKPNGDLLDGWPIKIYEDGSGGNLVTPSIADINNDGFLEIIFQSPNKLHVFDYKGNELWSKDFGYYGLGIHKTFSVIGDLNADNKSEIVKMYLDYANADDYITVLDLYGNTMPGWPKFLANWPVMVLGAQNYHSPAIGNLDDDNELEIVVPISSGRLDEEVSYIKVFKANGTLLWQSNPETGRPSSPIIADVNNDGENEVITAFRDGRAPYYTLFKIFDSQGRIISNWSRKISFDLSMIPEPAALSVGDMNNDGFLEILTSGDYREKTNILIFNYTGAILNDDWVPENLKKNPSSPIIADVNNDSKNEIIYNMEEKVVIRNSNGSKILQSFQMVSEGKSIGGSSVPVIDDIDNDGKYELIASSTIYSPGEEESINVDKPGTMNFYVWEFEDNIRLKAPWPSYRHDIQQTGNYGDCIDEDGDGYSISDFCGIKDCDDTDNTYWYNIIYPDVDGDGYGYDNSTSIVGCFREIPAGFLGNTGDCNDTNATINPIQPEICDGLDNDCDEQVDENNAGCSEDTPICMNGTCTVYAPIETCEELQNIKNNLFAAYLITKDIDCSGFKFTSIGIGTNFEIIPFKGVLNGGGYKVINLNITRDKQSFGFFAKIDYNGKVENFNLENVYISNWNEGAIGAVSDINYGTISNSSVTGNIIGGGNVGGIAGKNYGLISKSFVIINISASSNGIGGFVGINDGNISQSYSFGNVISLSSSIGGFVGTNTNNGKILNSYSRASVSGEIIIGGFAGYNWGNIENSYSTGQVAFSNRSEGFSGGSKIDVINSFWDMETSGMDKSSAGTGKTTQEMKQKRTYINWDFVNIWAINERTGYPYFASMNIECQPNQEQQCGSSEIGMCRKGIQRCINNKWGECEGEVLPAPEICDGLDNDCDVQVDENNGNCSSNLPYCVSGRCVKCRNDADCNDDLFCNGQEKCTNNACETGTLIDCSANDVSVSQCDYIPDENSKTWDFFSKFESACDDNLDTCAVIYDNWENEITHECNKENCSAQCTAQNDCNDGNSSTLDICLPDCICMNNEISFNDAKVSNLKYNGKIINGKEKEIYFDIENIGSQDLTSVNYYIEYEKDGQFIKLANENIGEIKTGQKITITKKITVHETGAFNLKITIEADNDQNVNDNTALMEINVLDDICYIDEMNWSKTNVNDGDNVWIEIKGENCDEKLINLSIFEKDGEIPLLLNSDDLILNLENVLFSKRIKWQAEWQEDEKGDPEYYFRIETNGIANESGKEINDLLRVRLIEAKQQTKKIQLKPGRNAFSLPLIASNMSVDSVFKDIKDKLVKIYAYDNEWRIHYFNISLDENLSNLNFLEIGKGYVLIVKEDAKPQELKFDLTGTKRNSNLELPSIRINKGWGLIGTFSAPVKAKFILGEMGYEIYALESGEFIEVDSERELKEDEGYWVYSNEEKEINIIPAFSSEDSESIFGKIWRRIFG